MNWTNKIKTKIFYASMIILALLFFLFARYSRWLLEKNHLVTIGYIDDVKIIGRERFVNIKYHYLANGDTCFDDASFNQRQITYEKFKLLNKKWIPVVYHKSATRLISCPLIFPNDYKDFNVPFPDSLKWILPLIDE